MRKLLRPANFPRPHGESFDEEYGPEFVGHGSIHDISYESNVYGFYLADGSWYDIPKRPMGFRRTDMNVGR